MKCRQCLEAHQIKKFSSFLTNTVIAKGKLTGQNCAELKIERKGTVANKVHSIEKDDKSHVQIKIETH